MCSFRFIMGLYIIGIIVLSMLLASSRAFLFRVDQFTDVTEKCQSEKKLSYILNEDKPAMYVSIDPNKPKNYKNKRREVLRSDEIIKKYTMKTSSSENAINAIKNLHKGMDKELIRNARIIFRKLLKNYKNSMRRPFSVYANKTFDCSIQFETELPKGDKTSGKYDALSLVIVELSHNALLPVEHPNLGPEDSSGRNNFGATNSKTNFQTLFDFGLVPNSRVEVVTSGKNGKSYKNVTKRAQYSERIWPGHNPNFLLSGQLSGFDSIDYRTKIDPQVGR